MKVLQIIFKNSSTLDFTLPIFWDLKSKNRTNDIKILYWCLSKKEKIFTSPQSEAFFQEFGILEFTLADFARPGTRPIVRLFQLLAGKIRVPVTPLRDALCSFHLRAMSENIIFKLFSPIKSAVELYLIDYQRIFNFFQYDVLFFDNRSKIQASNLDNIFNWIDSKKVPVVLCPHAPHYVNESEGFFPLIPGKVKITDYCQVWYTHKLSKPWTKNPEIISQCKLSGYPGFDKRWIEFLQSRKKESTNDQIINVVVIGRKFYHEGIKKNEAEFVTLTFEETLLQLFEAKRVLNGAFKDKKYHIIYKPHPSSGLKLVESLLLRVFDSFEVFTDLLYFVLPRANIVISPYSTSLLIPCYFELPVFLINSKLQQQIGAYWNQVDEMYRGLTFFCENESEFKIKMDNFAQNSSLKNSFDKAFLEKYFPSDSLKLIQDILEKKENN